MLRSLSLVLRILVLCTPLFWSYTSKSAWRSSNLRYIRLFTEAKGGYDIESLFTKSDTVYKEQPTRQTKPRVEKVTSVRITPNKSQKPRYNPTNENKKSKYSATKMRLRSTNKTLSPSTNSFVSYPQHVQEIFQMARKGSINLLLNAITNANNITMQKEILIANNSSRTASKLMLREYNMLIKELCDGGKIEHSTKILSEMSKAGVKPSVVTYTTLISRAGAWQKVQLAEMYFRKMLEDGIPADAQAYNSLINAYAKAGETDRALKVLHDMDEANVSPTVVTFNTLIESCARTGKPQRANEVFELMKRRGLHPDERSYSSIVQACCQAGQVEAAFKVVQKMDGDGIKVSLYTYSSLLHGLGKMGDLVRAFEILDQMRSRQLSPNVVTMSSLVYSCGKHGKLDLAIKIYKEMLKSPDEADRPNSITCSSLVDACLKEGKVAKAFAVVKDMRFRKVALTEVTYTSLITELSRLNQLDRILEAIVGDPDENSAAISEGTSPNSKEEGDRGISALFPTSAVTISTSELDNVDSSNVSENAPILTESAEELMEVFREKSNYKGVVSVFEALKTRGMTPGPKVYKTLMNSLYEDSVRRSDDMDVATTTNTIPVESINIQVTPGSAGFNDHQGSGQKQMRHDELFRLYLVFQEMRVAGVRLDAAVYNTLINACAGVGDLDKALETVQAMQDEGIHPDVITYTSLLKACGINGCDGTVELAEEIFAQMQQKTNHFSNTVEPTELTFQRLMQVHLRAPEGQVNTKRVWDLLDDMVRRGLKPGVVSYRSCVKAAVIEGDVDRSLAMLLVIRDQTRIGFDFRSWQGVVYLCSTQDRRDDEFRLRREIDEANSLMDERIPAKIPKR